MSGYEQRLAEDKAEIRRRVVTVGEQVGEAVGAAVTALLARDTEACYRIILGDLPINREIRALDRRCHAFIARHLPSAGHLRFVSSVLQMNVALERIGDYAVTIAREAVRIKTAVPQSLVEDLTNLTERSCQVLRDAITAFSERDADLARKTRPRAKSVGRSYGQVYTDLTREGAALPIGDAFALLSVFRRVDRVSDQAKNVSEETLFELTGEMKAPKRYRVLFVDRAGTTLAPLAESLARKAFPESGDYSSAAVAPAGQMSATVRKLADRRGIVLEDVSTAALSNNVSELERFHVIVALEEDVLNGLDEVPYSSVVLHWRPVLPEDGDDAAADEAANQLAREIRDLMVLMRGDDAQ